MGNDLAKDVKKLTKHLRKYGKKYGDNGTYKERDSKHIVIEFHMNGKLFKTTFPKTPSSWTAVKNTFSQIRRNFKECGVLPPQFSEVRMFNFSSSDIEKGELETEIFGLLDSYEDE